MDTAPAKETLATRLVSRLREAILRGELAPGSRVALDRLREQHDVSLSPMREAVSRLAATGLVEMQDQRGYRIAPVSEANLAEIVLLRAALEPLALGDSIDRADLAWEGEVLGALHRLKGAGPEAWHTARRDLHLTLISNARLPMVADLCARLVDLDARYQRIFGGGAGLAGDDLAGIVAAAVARDRDTAAALLVAHIRRVGAALAERVRAGPPAQTGTG